MPALTDDEVSGIWWAHAQYVDEMRPEWKLTDAAFATKAWEQGRPFGLDYAAIRDKLEFQLELNKIEPFITMIGADLFVNEPRCSVHPPGVTPSRAGRPRSMGETAEKVQAVGDEWLYREAVQTPATDAYRMAFMYGGAAFRIGTCDAKEPLDRLWLEAVPRWEAVWDRYATPATERYRGHCRMRSLEEAKGIVGDDLEGIQAVALSDVVGEGLGEKAHPLEDRRLKAYVRLLELYDLQEKTQTFYVVQGSDRATHVKRVGKAGEAGSAPWTMPDGKAGVPLIPIVLLHRPGLPFDGIPAIRRLVQINMEQNLAATIVINAARRDAARTILTKPGTFSENAIKQIKAGYDLEIVEVMSEEVNIQTAVAALQTPPLPSSLASMFSMLEAGWRDVQGTSDIQQGRQQKYVSAREAGLLASYGERSLSDNQAQMHKCVADLLALVFVGLGALGQPITVQVNGKAATVKPDDLVLPWVVEIADTGATPASAQRMNEDFSAIQATLMTLTNIAAGTPGPDGPPKPAVMRAAQLQLDYLVHRHGLPDEMSWSGGLALLDAEKEKEPDAAAIAASLSQVPPGPPANGSGPPALPPDLGPQMPPGLV